MLKKTTVKIKIIGFCIAVISVFSLMGCNTALPGTKASSIIETDITNISTETSSLGVDLSKKGSSLISGRFYVLHDGIYYPAYCYMSNYDKDDELADYVKEERQLYYLDSNESDIPTLFLSKGDKLIYYNETEVLDYVLWERYKDLGYTVGLFDLKATTSKRYYIDVKEGNSIVTGSGLDDILNDITETDYIGIDKIGNVDVSSNLVEGGLITGTTKGQKYSLDVYSGTNYHHYIATANVHAFKAYEQFATTEINALREYTYEIKVPDYFVNGYYRMFTETVKGYGASGLIRIVYEDNFNILDADKFNKQLLYIYTDEDLVNIKKGKKIDKSKGTYSTCEELNKYTTEVVGSLGYKDGTTDSVTETEKKDTLSTATIRLFNINFPADSSCTVELTPKRTEPSGDVYIYVGNTKTRLSYDSVLNTYSTSLTGDGNTYTLFVSGIWGSYDIKLINCSRDTAGKSKSELPTSLNTSGTANVTNNKENN